MIEIVKEGKIRHQETCSNCGCVFKYDAEDVEMVTVLDDRGAHYPVIDKYYIECPFCKKDLLLHEKFTQKEIDIMRHTDK